MTNNNTNKQPKYVKYYKNLAYSEFADIKTTQAAEINYLGNRDGAGTREYSEADAFLADTALSLLAAGAEKISGPLYNGMKIKYEGFRCSAEEFRKIMTGEIIPRRDVEHVYQKSTERQKANNIAMLKNKYYKAAGFIIKEISPESGQGKERLNPENIKEKKIILVFPPYFLTFSFFFAPSNLQAKIKKLKQENPDLFYQRSAEEKKFKVTDLMARKFFLYLGLHRNNTDKIKIKTDDLFQALKPGLLTAAGKCRSYPAAEKMLLSLIDVYNAVIDLQPADGLAKIKEIKETEKHQFLLVFSTVRQQRKQRKMRIKAHKTGEN